MERKEFIKKTLSALVAIPLGITILNSCESIYYAEITKKDSTLILDKSEFLIDSSKKKKERSYVLISTDESDFPICVYKIKEDQYVASLLKCTHQGCELEIGGGIYNCPCHGSEFNTRGEVLEGPATRQLTTYKIITDDKKIYLQLA